MLGSCVCGYCIFIFECIMRRVPSGPRVNARSTVGSPGRDYRDRITFWKQVLGDYKGAGVTQGHRVLGYGFATESRV